MRIPVLALSLVVMIPAGATAQTDLVADAVQAHGTPASLIFSIRLTGTSTVGAVTRPVTILGRLDGSIRIDYGNPVQKTVVTTYQGRWERNGGQVTYRSPHVGIYAQLDMFSVLGVRQFTSGGATRQSTGNGMVGSLPTARFNTATNRSREFYRREIRDEAEVHVDPQSGLIAGIARRQYASESLDLPFVTSYAFKDHRNVAGLIFPHLIEKYLDGLLIERITVTGVELNPSFAADVFER